MIFSSLPLRITERVSKIRSCDKWIHLSQYGGHFSFCSAFQIVGNTVLKAIVAHPQKRFVLFFCRGKQRHINCCSDTAITVGLDTSTYQNQIHVRLYVEAVVVQRFPWEVTCGQPVPKKHFTRYLAISGHDQTFFRSKINP